MEEQREIRNDRTKEVMLSSVTGDITSAKGKPKKILLVHPGHGI